MENKNILMENNSILMENKSKLLWKIMHAYGKSHMLVENIALIMEFFAEFPAQRGNVLPAGTETEWSWTGQNRDSRGWSELVRAGLEAG